MCIKLNLFDDFEIPTINNLQFQLIIQVNSGNDLFFFINDKGQMNSKIELSFQVVFVIKNHHFCEFEYFLITIMDIMDGHKINYAFGLIPILF